jgi:hypothetical protein
MSQPATQPSVTDVLFGGHAPRSAQLDVGREFGGRVVNTGVHPERTYDPLNPGRGEIKRFPSGDVIFGIHVDVATTLREDSDDDGTRRIYAEGQRCKAAIAQAVQAAGAQGVEPGGLLYVTKTGKEATPSGVEANTWAARYVTPANAALQQPQQQPAQQPQQGWPATAQQGTPPAFYGQQQSAPQQPIGLQEFAPQQAAQQPQQQPQAGPTSRYTPEQLAALAAAGIDPATLPQ